MKKPFRVFTWKCPICGGVLGVKAAALHLDGHVLFEPDRVAAWREAQP